MKKIILAAIVVVLFLGCKIYHDKRIVEAKTILRNELLTKKEKKVLKLLYSYNCWERRRICIGESTHAIAWTDSHGFVAINRNMLENLSFETNEGACRLIVFMVHEMAHDLKVRGIDILSRLKS